MQFADGFLLALLAAAALVLLIGIVSAIRRARQTARFFRAGGGDLLRGQRGPRPWLHYGLLALAVALLALAAARPQLGSRETEIRQEGIALAVTVDVSLSMAAEDRAPNRFAWAGAEIDALLERLQGDRVGLVIFAGAPFVRFPLTRDTAAARAIVQALSPGEGLVPLGTDLAAAIETAATLLATTDAATRVILLISDGESLRGDALIAARQAAAGGVRLFTASVGSEAGATIPLADPRTGQAAIKIDAASGRPVISRANPAALAALAAAGGGRFIALDRPGALSDFAADFAALEASAFAVDADRLPIERFQIFAAIAIALLILEPLLSAARRRTATIGRRGRTAAFGVGLALVALIAAACTSGVASHNEAGNRLFDQGRYDDALGSYRAAQTVDPGEARLNLNAGRALHALGEYDRAITETVRAISASAPALSARAFYQLGNHRLALGEFLAARNAYIEALLLNPGDDDAKFNLELVNLLLATTLQPPPGSDPEDTENTQPDPSAEPSAEQREAPADPSSPGEGQPGDSAGGAEGDPRPSQGLPGDGLAGQANATDEATQAAAAELALAQALDELDREDPTLEQALAILDALRQRQPRDRLGLGPAAPPIEGREDY